MKLNVQNEICATANGDRKRAVGDPGGRPGARKTPRGENRGY